MIALDTTARPTNPAAMPFRESSAEHQLPGGQAEFAAHASSALGNQLAGGHDLRDTQAKPAASTNFPATNVATAPRFPSSPGTNLQEGGDQVGADAQCVCVASLLLGLSAAMLDDLEGIRIATENRVRAATEHGLPAGAYEHQLAAVAVMEHRATLDLQRAMRLHPLGPWVKRTRGVGEKQGARLIAAIGDPWWKDEHEDSVTKEVHPARPRRGPAELWAYCGYAPGQQRRKGVKSNWNADAKMRAYLCAEAAVKAGVRRVGDCDDTDGYDVSGREAISPLGQKYLDARSSWADRLVSEGHKHNHALRVVAKEILKDMWRESARLRGQDVDRPT